jgi:hypothetical protein
MLATTKAIRDQKEKGNVLIRKCFNFPCLMKNTQNTNKAA